jgi:hypothetical protein
MCAGIHVGGERGVLLAPFVAAAAPDLRSRILSATEICQDQIADPWNKLKLLTSKSPTTTP